MAKECIDRIKKVTDLTDSEALDLLEEVNDHLTRLRGKGDGRSTDELRQEIFERLSTVTRENKLIQKRNAVMNALRFSELEDSISRFNSDLGKENPVDALEAILVGNSARAFGARASVDARQKALKGEFIEDLISQFESNDLMDIMQSGALDREIARELFEINFGRPGGVTKSKEALEAARILANLQKKMIGRENSVGSFIKELPGYIIKQAHDVVKLNKIGRDAWKQIIHPLLDLDTMELQWGIKSDDLDDFLDAAFDNIVYGREFEFGGGKKGNPLNFSFTGAGNLAKKISAERVLHFKDADSFMTYHEQFSQGNILANTVNSLSRAADNIGLMERFGSNPEYMFERLLKSQFNKYRKTNPDIADQMRRGLDLIGNHKLRNYFAEVSGQSRNVGNLSLARWGSIIRALQSMAKLGGAVISSLSDIAAQAGEANYHGVPLLKAYSNAIADVFMYTKGNQKTQLAKSIGIGLDGILGDIHARFSGTDTMPGKMTNMMQLFFKLNLLTWWTDAHKTGTVRMLSNNMASFKHLGFKDIDPDLANVMRQYGLEANEWDFVRSHGIVEVDGDEFIDPGVMNRASNDALKQMVASKLGISVDEVRSNQIERFKQVTENNIRSYFIDSTDWAVPTPGAKERAWMNLGTKRGTIVGEGLRFLMQFKSFPITFTTKTFGRELYGRESRAAGIGALAHIMIGMTALGYVAQSAKDAIKGLEPRNPSKASTWTAAFVQGGGAGIYGDLLFSEVNRYGNSMWTTFAGPTASAIENVAKVAAGARDALFTGDWDSVGSGAVKAGMQNVPFGNLFYTKAAIDYLFMNRLYETLNPGYLNRLKKRARENEQDYFIDPTAF